MTKEEALRIVNNIDRNILTDEECYIVDNIFELVEPSLPSDLDEAAEEYGYINWQSEDYHEGASEGLPFDAIGHTERCFKAGAEWMAGKWETIDGEITTTSDNGWEIIRIPKKLYPLGTKVTVQIRKK